MTPRTRAARPQMWAELGDALKRGSNDCGIWRWFKLAERDAEVEAMLINHAKHAGHFANRAIDLLDRLGDRT